MTPDSKALAIMFLCVLALVAVGLWLYRKSKPAPAEDLAAEQLADAQRKHLEEAALAEYHAALASMYEARAKRLAPVAQGDAL